MTLVPAFLELSEPAIVTPRMCEKLHEELSWTDHRGKKHDLLPDTTTSIYYDRVGHSTWNDNLDCRGETYYHKGKVYPKMVITSNRKITLSTEEAELTGDQTMKMLRRDVELNCLAKSQGCQTRSGTFIWTPPKPADLCPYYQTRNW